MKRIIIVMTLLAVSWFTIVSTDSYAAGEQPTQKGTPVKGASEEAAVKSTMASFYTALSSRDMSKMQAIWAHVPYATLLNPRDKAAAVGWSDISKRWQDVFDHWSYLNLTSKELPQVHVKGNAAWSHSMGLAQGTGKDGQQTEFVTLQTDVFEKIGNRWLLVSHHASLQP